MPRTSTSSRFLSCAARGDDIKESHSHRSVPQIDPVIDVLEEVTPKWWEGQPY
jgi:hypothetical protein